jgi:glucose-6-phosphate isomerase
MLLESEDTGQVKLLPLLPNTVVYVPGYTAHRTVNVGSGPLTYIGIFPSQAGHDYGSLSRQNFRHVIVEKDSWPVLMERAEFLASILGEST